MSNDANNKLTLDDVLLLQRAMGLFPVELSLCPPIDYNRSMELRQKLLNFELTIRQRNTLAVKEIIDGL